MTTTTLDAAAITRLTAQPVPRYTSDPTAPHFHPGIDAATYASWLAALPAQARLSLYAHIPFCDTLCWFCGCSTKITHRYAPISTYLDALAHEIDTVASLIPPGAVADHIHWGGGSPTILSPSDITRLASLLRQRFTLAPNADFAVEVDPRGMGQDRIDALVEAGLTRVSIGVQDFDPDVQRAINRVQTVAETRAVVDAFRAGGVRSLNIDAIYGLPGQHLEQLSRTLAEVIALAPDRIALFGYAHVPWMKKHQSLIPANDLPGVVERHAQAEAAARILKDAGYIRVGIDHFARPDDALAQAATTGSVQRNFQGYTLDPADALIGLGASAIGRLPQGHVQNEAATGIYQTAVSAGRLATTRGIALSPDDRLRGAVIERLMCDLTFSAPALTAAFGPAAVPVLEIARAILAEDDEGFVTPTADGFRVTEAGRPFLRILAARFDAYLPQRAAGHSSAV